MELNSRGLLYNTIRSNNFAFVNQLLLYFFLCNSCVVVKDDKMWVKDLGGDWVLVLGLIVWQIRAEELVRRRSIPPGLL